MSDLRELYQEIVLDHSKRPRGFGKLEGATHRAQGYNPLCGDQMKLYLDVEDGMIKDAAFQGKGCAISKASASLMTAAVIGKPVDEAEALFRRVHAMLTGDATASRDTSNDGDGLGKLAVFAGVREFPSRIKCASLPWHTLRAALSGAREAVTTE